MKQTQRPEEREQEAGISRAAGALPGSPADWSRLSMLSEVGRRTTAILSLEELLRSAVDLIRETFAYYMVNIFLVDRDELVVSACTLPELQATVGKFRLRIGEQGITGWVAANGKPLNVPDVRLDSRYRRHDTVELRTRSELAVPITLKGTVTGVLDVQSEATDAYSDLDIFTLQTVADQLAVAIENARLYDALQRELLRRKQMEDLLQDLHDAGLALQRAATPEAVFETARTSLRGRGLEVSPLLWDDERETLASPSGAVPAPLPAAIQSIRDGEPAVLGPDTVVAGLRTEGRFLGVVTIRGPGLGADQVPALLGFAAQIAAARRRAELLRDLEASLGELHSAQEQLLQSQKMEAVGRLAGGVAHDFNNQLTAINGYAELLKEEIPWGDPRRSAVEEIISASRRAAGLTRQLLAFSRKQVLQPRAVDLVALIRGLRAMLERIIGENVQLETSVDDGPVIVRADPAQLEHVIVNLVLNARDAMPAGGVLTVSAYRSTASDSHCVLTVEDTGVGMSEEVRSRLFEPYFTTKAPGKGTGLGLSTVYGIVTQSGGTVGCESEPGKGTVFTIVLPATDERPGDSAAGEPRPKSAGGSEAILVVEDERQVRELVVRVLQGAGYTVTVAETAQRGLDHITGATTPPALVVTDIMLPGDMSGFELARRLRERHPSVRVIAMSGYYEKLAAGDEPSLLPGAFLSKPFSPAELLSAVRKLLDAPARP